MIWVTVAAANIIGDWASKNLLPMMGLSGLGAYPEELAGVGADDDDDDDDDLDGLSDNDDYEDETMGAFPDQVDGLGMGTNDAHEYAHESY